MPDFFQIRLNRVFGHPLLSVFAHGLLLQDYFLKYLLFPITLCYAVNYMTLKLSSLKTENP